MSELPFSKTEIHFILQGINALQQETVSHRNVMIHRLVPGENNLATLVEYYDKRSTQLQQLQKKIAAIANPG